DMDDEGTDAHFMVPTLWVSVVGLPDVALEVGLIRAYHRHANEFCGQFPGRLTTAIVASTRHVDEAVLEIKQWGPAKWALAGSPRAGKGTPRHSPTSQTDRDGRTGILSPHGPPQHPLNPAVLSGLPGPLGQHLPRPARLAPVGRDAVHGRLHRRRNPGSPPPPAHGRARVRLWVAPLLGQANGRAGGLRRRRGSPQARAERIPQGRPRLLYH